MHKKSRIFAWISRILAMSLVTFMLSTNAYSLYFFDGGYDDTGFVPNRTYVNFTPNEFLNPYSGNLIIKNTDIHLPGNAGMDLNIDRIYNSKQIYFPPFSYWIIPEGAFGYRWDFFFGRIIPNANNSFLPEAELAMSDGSVYQVYENNHPNINSNVNSGYIADNFAILEHDEINDIWTVKSKDGTVYIFDQKVQILGAPAGAHYYPSLIEDTSGNTISIEYYDCCNITDPGSGGTLGSCGHNSNGLTKVPHIKQVTDSVGRVIKFNWLNTSCRASENPNVISSIEVNGEVYRYMYSPVYAEGTEIINGYMLTGVKPPEGPGWTYSYEWNAVLPNGEIKILTYPSGATVEYEFASIEHEPKLHDSSYKSRIPEITRVLTGRSISGPGIMDGTWEIDYGFPEGSNSTQIETPCGSREIFYFYTTIEDYYAGEWASSLLYEKQIVDDQGRVFESETYSWSPYTLSTSDNNDYDFSYPLLGNRTTTIDGIDYSINYEYDTFYALPTRIIENPGNHGQLSRTTTVQYSEVINGENYILGLKDLLEVKNGPDKRLITYNYDENTGNLLSLNRFGILSEFSYYPDGNLKWIKNAKGVYTHFLDYNFSIPEIIKFGSTSANAADSVFSESRNINWNGTVRSKTDGMGYTTNYQYDGLRRLVRIIPPESGESSTVIEYDNNSGGYYSVNKGDSEITNILDGFGRTVETYSNAGIKTEINYDQCGRIIYSSGPDYIFGQDKGNHFIYDALGRLKSVKHSDGTEINYGYKANSVIKENERGLKTVFEYGSFGDVEDKRLVKITDPYGNSTDYGYDILGNITRVKQSGGVIRNYEYDSRNHLVSKKEPESGVRQYKYDEVGNLVSKRDSNGDDISYTYDLLNRLLIADHPGDEDDIYYTYDNNNNITSVSSSSGSYEYRYSYDASNRMYQRETSLNRGALNYTINYDYDGKNNISNIKYPSGKNVGYKYDTANRVIGILDGFENYYLGNMTYHPSGSPLHYEDAYGVKSDFTYDVRDRLKSIKVTRPYPELRILKEGLGDGIVRSINILGVDCGNDCSQVYPESGTMVTLEVLEDKDSDFIRWTGDPECESNEKRITIVMNDNRTCIAVFSLKGVDYRLTVEKSGDGTGTVSSIPEGINCGEDCEESYEYNTEVDLKAVSSGDSYFHSWEGDPDCMDGHVLLVNDINCVALFEKRDSHELRIQKAGSGEGVVTSKSGVINCGEDCSEQYTHGTTEHLQAEPASDSRFTGWGGHPDCNDGVVMLDTDKKCIAVFNKEGERKYRLKVDKSGDGSGTITSEPSGIECGTDCVHNYTSGEKVSLAVSPDYGSVFTGWSGDPDCDDGVINITSNITCIAKIKLKENRRYMLSVSRYGSGEGTVRTHPPGISCGSDCTEHYDENTVVTLIAEESENSVFQGWRGDDDCLDGVVTMKSDTNCSANFTTEIKDSHTLKISKAGDGTGVVSSTPNGIMCGADCSASYDEGTNIHLDVVPDPGSEFGGWTGDEDCTDGIINIVSDMECTANFDNKSSGKFYSLEIELPGGGNGVVTDSSGGISCGIDSAGAYMECTAELEEDTTVELFAMQDETSGFGGWYGQYDCIDGVVTMDGNKRCIAYFWPMADNIFELSVNNSGGGSGYVGSFPEGINCGSDCNEFIYENKYLSLYAIAYDGSVFTEWEGDPDCQDGLVLIDSDTQCSAIFDIKPELVSPGITFAYNPSPNENGWYGAESVSFYGGVEVRFLCRDNSGSGLSGCSSPETVNEEGIRNITGIASDNDENTSEVTAPVRIDKTAPVVNITNYDDGDVAKLTEVIPVTEHKAIATIRGDASDNLSGPDRVECYAYKYSVHRETLLTDDGFVSDESDLGDDEGIITGSEFECEVELSSDSNILHSVNVRLYDKAGNLSEDRIDLAYYGYTDITPPEINNISVDSDYCHDASTERVSANVKISAAVSDDRSGPDFDSDTVNTNDFPIDIDFECTDNGSGTSLCSGGGSGDVSNIYRTEGFFRIFYARQSMFEYSIEDNNGNLTSESISLEIPPLEQLLPCQ